MRPEHAMHSGCRKSLFKDNRHEWELHATFKSEPTGSGDRASIEIRRCRRCGWLVQLLLVETNLGSSSPPSIETFALDDLR